MLDKLLSVKHAQSHLDVFAVINAAMDTAQAVDLLLSVFDYERGDALANALVAEIKRRKALEKNTKTRVSDARRKVVKNAN